MKYSQLVLIGVLVLLALVAAPGRAGPGVAGASTDSDGDGISDSADSCSSLAEDPDGVDDLDGCPDTDVSISAAMDEAYSVTVSSMESRTVEVWIQNGNYPADILVHALSISTVGACEVSLIAAPGDGVFPHITDEDGDTISETYFYLLEWEVSLDAGESYHTSRDYEVVCSLLGEHSFEMQVDAVPRPPVEEEDVEDLPNVHKSFPLVTVIDYTGLDSDGDGFSDSVEEFVGTDSTGACASTPAADDEEPDALPTDFNDDQVVNIVDLNKMLPPPLGSWGTTPGDPAYTVRRDINPGGPDGVINIVDLNKVLPAPLGAWGQTCTP